ncbi:MAG: hypothetical protein ACOYXY_05615, partial [Thermodesulfobacteriota bacterium]
SVHRAQSWIQTPISRPAPVMNASVQPLGTKNRYMTKVDRGFWLNFPIDKSTILQLNGLDFWR